MHDATYWINQLGLEPHPEGGYFKEIYRSRATAPGEALPGYDGPRNLGTSIYFLLQAEEFSAFHRIKQDELWHFYAGSTLTVHVLDAAGRYAPIRMGPDPEAGECLQTLVPGGSLFGASMDRNRGYALVGCTCVPGFDFADFEMPSREELLGRYPQHSQLIHRLTRAS
ncbi:MAG: cupin domain-containing protein [Deltaproteobacteria bacterium]|nr:cupin domain-containing protein [Deltaproteobacteria bacterium]